LVTLCHFRFVTKDEKKNFWAAADDSNVGNFKVKVLRCNVGFQNAARQSVDIQNVTLKITY
jgi:hypothetical protein